MKKLMTVRQVSRQSGVSVRTLHYYDEIGLLPPAQTTEAGYRLYGERELRRLETVLMFRELGFALTEIKTILDNPDFDLKTALVAHIEMLKMAREHIDGLIAAAEKMTKGEDAGFAAFDRTKMGKYAEEVKRKWGGTEAYRESEEKLKSKTDVEKKSIAEGLTEIFTEFGKLKNGSPDSPEAQTAVKELQDYITDNFYNCTKEILSGLGITYTADGRFKENIDEAGGEGTAAFVGEAIKIYCR